MGFSLFGPLHLCVLGLIAALTGVFVLVVILRRPDHKILQFLIGTVLASLEGWKIGYLQGSGAVSFSDLPLHLCSMGIPVLIGSSLKQNATGGLLYLIFLPASLLALLYPGWNQAPLTDLRCFHGFLFHTLLLWGALTPLTSGSLRLKPKDSLRAMGLLCLLAAVMAPVNFLLGTNFLFLSEPPPLFPFPMTSGMKNTYPLILFPIVISVLALLHGLYILTERRRK